MAAGGGQSLLLLRYIVDDVHNVCDNAALPYTWLMCVAAKGQELAQPAGRDWGSTQRDTHPTALYDTVAQADAL